MAALKGLRQPACKDDADEVFIQFESSAPNKPPIKIKDVHISSSSHIFDPQESYVGFIVYLCKDKRDFTLHDVHCRTGDIFIRQSDWIESNIKRRSQRGHYMHGRLFYSIFGCWKKKKHGFIGAGFSYYKGKWKFNSGTFNTINSGNNDDTYHDSRRQLHELEEQLLKKVVSCLYINHRWLEMSSDGRITRYELDQQETLVSQESNINCNVDLGKVHNARRLHGKVKWVSNNRDYGFIECVDIDQDIFVHYANIQYCQCNVDSCLIINKNVEFGIINTYEGWQATDVRPFFFRQ